MITPTQHLPRKLLIDYVAGRAPEAVSLAVACHATLCGRCQGEIDHLEAAAGAALETGQGLAPSHPAAQVDQDLADAAGNLEAQHDLILGGQGARGNHQPRQLPFGRGLHPHGPLSARRGPRLLLRRRRGRLIGAAGAGGEADEENQEAQDRADSNRHRPDIVSQNAARR